MCKSGYKIIIYILLENKIKVYAGVDTLEYLYKGGRLSRASAAVGELTGIKPIVTVSDGRVEVVGKALGKMRAMNTVLEKIKSHHYENL